MKGEAIGYNLMAKHVREKIDMLDAFIDLLESMEEDNVGCAGYEATALSELRKGYGSADLPRRLAYIGQHFVSVMAMDHMRDKPRS